VILSESGLRKAERLAGVDSFFTGEHMDWPHHIETALKAHHLYRRDRDYVVKDGEVIIVDEFTGRMMPGRRWSDGLHQAIEAKEGIRIREENQTLATITLQNYFKMYQKLAGMTGTAMTEAGEFWQIYRLDVVAIPTNKPLIRTNYPDVIFGTEEEKFDAIEEEIARIHATGRPILVGTTSIEKSEMLSERLKMRGIRHEVLNAKHHEREAEIVARAGQRGAVTIATNMAGRGTDIILGPGVAELGGLHIIGTERHEARRIDNQLRGRAGRQGDPGSSQFFLSLEDDLFRKFAPPWIRAAIVKLGLKEGERIESRMVSRSIEKAQKNVEAHNFALRKRLLEYDEIRNEQRQVIYGLRQAILRGEDVHDRVRGLVEEAVEEAVRKFTERRGDGAEDWAGLAQWLHATLAIPMSPEELESRDPAETVARIMERVDRRFAEREQEAGGETFREIERLVLLDRIDDKWKDLLYNVDQLRDIIGLRSYAQQDPQLEFKREATALFGEMMTAIRDDVVRLIFRVQARVPERERMARRWQPTEYRKDKVGQFETAPDPNEEEEEKTSEPVRVGTKVGRNAPCPCGSGKKYKRCCGA
jgi:preprotein translocase subunit SecA